MLSNIHPKYRLVVSSKNGASYNPIHSMIHELIATIIDLPIGKRGWFAVLVDDEYWDRIHTSTVEGVTVDEKGNVTLTTRNTVYTFNKIDGGGSYK